MIMIEKTQTNIVSLKIAVKYYLLAYIEYNIRTKDAITKRPSRNKILTAGSNL